MPSSPAPGPSRPAASNARARRALVMTSSEWSGEQVFPLLVMPGLVPGILFGQPRAMRQGYFYLLTNRPNGVLYAGVTSDLSRRAYEHRMGLVPGFTSRYGITRLVH
jgi:hypothetical protein